MIRRSKPIARRAALKRGKGPARVRKTPMGKLRKDLDELFARYVKDRDGNTCCTCGRTITHPNDHHAGHYIGRSRMSLRWDPKNVHVQCGIPCNGPKRGAPREYAQFLLEKYGPAEVARIYARKRIDKKWARHELEALIAALRCGGAEYEIAYYGLTMEAQ